MAEVVPSNELTQAARAMLQFGQWDANCGCKGCKLFRRLERAVIDAEQRGSAVETTVPQPEIAAKFLALLHGLGIEHATTWLGQSVEDLHALGAACSRSMKAARDAEKATVHVCTADPLNLSRCKTCGAVMPYEENGKP